MIPFKDTRFSLFRLIGDLWKNRRIRKRKGTDRDNFTPYETLVFCYYKAHEIISQDKRICTQSAEKDLYVLLYTIAAFAASIGEGDEDYISWNIAKWLNEKYFSAFDGEVYEKENRFFHDRMQFYADVIDGKPLIGYCMIMQSAEDLSAVKLNFIPRCTIAFMDCAIDNLCLEDYSQHIPLASLDQIYMLSLFQSVIVPLSEVILYLFNDISGLKAGKK